MSGFGPSSSALRTQLLLASLALLAGVCLGRSDAPRGVSLPFVFDVKAVCDPPCNHAGLCIRNNTCYCSQGYEGETCQYANCYPKCKNGGECLRPGKCRCPPGFGGKYCHKVMCDGGCWNGGDCTAVNGVAKCICPSSWTGSRCEDAICPQGCRNGGSCVAPGICSCPEGWLGGACHTGQLTCTQKRPELLMLIHFQVWNPGIWWNFIVYYKYVIIQSYAKKTPKVRKLMCS
uniref:von Willebrand factor D and EGF domains n=1 Tax=Astyanax mexicanus TaxID=7994 RepID=A0A8B9K6C1_ASTMX